MLRSADDFPSLAVVAPMDPSQPEGSSPPSQPAPENEPDSTDLVPQSTIDLPAATAVRSHRARDLETPATRCLWESSPSAPPAAMAVVSSTRRERGPALPASRNAVPLCNPRRTLTTSEAAQWSASSPPTSFVAVRLALLLIGLSRLRLLLRRSIFFLPYIFRGGWLLRR